MRRFVVVCIASAVLLGAIVRARQSPAAAPPQTTFRAGTDLIPVDVSVLDGDRKPVRGLTAADFTVLEDGKPRAVAAFTAVDVPAAPRTTATVMDAASPAVWTRDAPHDVVANSLPAEGRLVVILFDRSIPQGQSVQVAQQIARAAIDELGPGDLAAVARSSGFGNEGRVQGFTSDRRLLLDAVQSRFQGMTVLPETVRGIPPPSVVPGDSDSTTDCYCGLCVYETIGQVASAMRDAPRRRKVLLFVGSAIQIEVVDPKDPCFGIVKEPRERMMRDLEMANVTVHSIDPAGLFTTSPMADYNSIHPPLPTLVPARNQANQRRLDDLRVLPSHTGGRLVANTNDPARLMPAVFAESQSYYLLGFEPAAPRDGLFHRIEVRVSRRGVNVHSRSGYNVEANVALPDRSGGVIDDGAALTEALKGPLSRPELSVSVSVVPFPRADEHTSPVAVVLGVAVPPNGGPRRFAITVGAFDVGGRSVQIHDQTVEVPAPPKGADRVSEGLLARLNLPPGRYEIRAAVKDEQTGAVGSVFSFADVLDTSREPFGLSGVVFRGPAPPAMSDHPMADIVPFVPTIARRFRSTEIVTAYLRVRTHGVPSAVQMTARVLDARGDVRSEEKTTLAPEAFDDGEAPYSLELPLVRLPAGEYLLRIEGVEADRQAAQEVRFAVTTETR